MKLSDLILHFPSCSFEGKDCEIEYIYSDSRLKGDSNIFCLNDSFGIKSIEYLDSARKNGYEVLLLNKENECLIHARELFPSLVLSAISPELITGEIASFILGRPSQKLKVIGVTGTNGKTSITHILYDLFRKNGYKAGVIGTINVKYQSARRHEITNDQEEIIIETGYTTPDSSTLNKILAEMAEQGVEFVFMEASSHGLNLGRLNGIHFKGCLFTNLTRDHLDFHNSMEDYFNDKFKIFQLLDASETQDKFGLVSADSPGGKEMLNECHKNKIQTTVFSLGENHLSNSSVAKDAQFDYILENIELSILHSRYSLKGKNFDQSARRHEIETAKDGNDLDQSARRHEIETAKDGNDLDQSARKREIETAYAGQEPRSNGESLDWHIQTSLLGHFNVINTAMAAISAHKLGLSEKEILTALENLDTVPGRFQILYDRNKTKTVVVDYAHTPDALENILQSIKQIQPDKIYTLFGCGGDRDRTKRPMMAEVAEKYSSHVMITSDNPRTENPEKILDEIASGFKTIKYERVEDRRTAIQKSVFSLPEGGILVVAGKGHEEYQIIGKEKIRFSDIEEVAKSFTSMDEDNRFQSPGILKGSI